MPESLNTALMLLVVGIITVFTILTLIVLLGNLLIGIINRFFPQTPPVSAAIVNSQQEIASNKMAAIISAVDIVTEGKGKVTSIQKKK